MNIHELANASGIGLGKLRKLEKLGALKLDKESEFVEELRFFMARNQRLTVAHMLTLLGEPAAIDELGAISPRMASRAREQMAALGDVKGSAAPSQVTAAIPDAAKGDDDAALIIAQWLIGVLPADPVSHAWVAARLLYPLNEYLREANARLVGLALLNVRKLPEFAGYWRSEKIGARNETRYFALDL